MAEPDNRHDSHPDLADLDAVRTGEASPETARHVSECPACRAALHDIGALAGEIADAEAPPEISIPEAVDRRMRMLAHTCAAEVRAGVARAERRRRILTPLRVISGAAAAAAVVVAAGVFTMSGSRAPMPDRAPEEARAEPVASSAADPMDVDASGAVDIVDAYMMSRKMKRGAAPGSWDFDEDGAVTAGDVTAVARRAVALPDIDGGI